MKFLYINTENIYPQDEHLIQGLQELGHQVMELTDTGRGSMFRLSKIIRRDADLYDAFIIGFTSPLLVLSVRLCAPTKKIFFNATLPQTEANIISRKEYGFLFYKALKWWLVDFLSFHFATKVLLESKAQIDFVSRLFGISKKKLVLSYSGLNERYFFFDSTVSKAKEFTVLFRGRFLPESGILTVLQAAKILETSGVQFLIIGHGFMYKEFNACMAELSPKNVRHIHDRLAIAELRNLMLSSHISLGQLADHPRLKRTLPCKLFESLALKLPYLTGRNKAVFELLTENETCCAVKPGDAQDLAEKILYLKDNPDILKRIGENGHALYKEKLTSTLLSKMAITQCFSEQK